ncbi:unnamed protein product [Bubo scandiacus]
MEPLQREPAGAETETEAEAGAGSKVKVDVLKLLRLRDQMKQQLMEYDTAVHANQESYPGRVKEKFIMRGREVLQRDLEEAKISFENKTLALQRSQLVIALRNRMKQNDNDSRLIMETVKHIVMLSRAIIEYQQQAREKEQKLIDIKRKRLSLKKAAEKLLQIDTVVKKQKEAQASTQVSKMLEKMHDNLQKEREMTTVIQHVFQNIIIGSRINWAEDPSLKAIVLQLEKNVHVL